jgi:iron complex outermembrane receptor protein
MERMRDKIILLQLLTAIISSPVTGQQNIADTISYRNLGEVIVSTNRLSLPLKVNPGAVSLVSTPILSSMPRSIAVDEALRLVPGVRIDNQANGSRIHMSIRGQGILSERGLRGIKVLIDGIPVNDPTGFASDLYDVDWSAVERVEVFRGPSASLYGGGANAGILNIKTSDGGEGLFNGQIFSSSGSNGFMKLMAQTNGSVEKLKYNFSFSNFKGSGYRYHTAFTGGVVNGKVTWQPGKNVRITQLLTQSQYINQNAEGLNILQLSDPRQANPDAIPLNEYQFTKRLTYGLTSVIRIADNQQIDFTVFIKSTDYKEPGSSAVQYRKLYNSGPSLQYKINWGSGKIKNNLSIGVDWQSQDIDEYKVPNIKIPDRTEKIGEIQMSVSEDTILLANQTISQRLNGLFLVDRIELGKNLSAVFSIRNDNISNALTDKMNRQRKLSGKASYKNIAARFGLAYNLNTSINLYANIGQGYLPPATEELMNNPESFGGFNADLVPATSLGQEAGIRGYAFNSLYYDLTLFHMDTKNDFYRYRMPSRPLETFYGNMGSSTRTGFEAFSNWIPVKNLTVQFAYTWSDFKYTSPDSIRGLSLPNSPAHQLYGDISYKFTKNIEAGVSTEFQSRWFIYTDKVHSNVFQEGFNLYHARIAYNFKIGRVRANVSLYGKNLTDKQYIAFTEPDPDGNSYQPSARRELFVSVRFIF